MSDEKTKSNTATGIAVKGSKLMMQLLVNNNPKSLDKVLGKKIEWLSPLKEDNYREYRLENREIQKKLSLNAEDVKFWPKNGPQWDGIAIADDGTILLFEAKAHTREVFSKCSASGVSKPTITDAIKKVFKDNDRWIDRYYQIANRYVFLSKLLEKGYSVKIVFIYFANDGFGKTSIDDWNANNKEIERFIREDLYDKTLEQNVSRIVIDVSMNFKIND